MTKRAVLAFAVGIVVVGIVRFGLTVSGIPNEVTRYASMTAVILAGCVYFGTRGLRWPSLARAAYFLVLPYMGVSWRPSDTRGPRVGPRSSTRPRIRWASPSTFTSGDTWWAG